MFVNSSFDYDVVCIGAGPANLSVAAALEDKLPRIAARTIMFEAGEDIVWQRGLLSPGALSQVSFIKDLATLRDPQSRFTFLKYLHSTGQLDDFLNMGTTLPFREEVSRYHKWVASQFANVVVQVAAPVRQIEPLRSGSGINGWKVEIQSGQIATARHIVVGVGRDARVPEPLKGVDTDRVIHSTEFAAKIRNWQNEEPTSIAVIGSAQSAAELALESGKLFPSAKRTIIMRSIGMIAYETSKFTNELFYPGYIDKFYMLNEADRRDVLAQMHRANYSGLAPHTLEALYNERYLSKLYGKDRIEFQPLTEIRHAEVTAGGKIRLALHSKYDGESSSEFDLVLLGTGFEPRMPKLVQSLAQNLGLNEIAVDRYYRLATGGSNDTGLCFVQGMNEATHGIADSLLSVQAARAEEITNLIAEATVEQTIVESFVKRFDETGLVHENGLHAQRLLPFPMVTPFEASWCIIRPGTSSTPHSHHEAEIFVAIEGEAILETSGKQQVFRKGDTAYFEPGMTHRVINTGQNDFVMYSIWWDDEMSKRQLQNSWENRRRSA
jgi:L-ornithine N5-oxygenase